MRIGVYRSRANENEITDAERGQMRGCAVDKNILDGFVKSLRIGTFIIFGLRYCRSLYHWDQQLGLFTNPSMPRKNISFFKG